MGSGATCCPVSNWAIPRRQSWQGGVILGREAGVGVLQPGRFACIRLASPRKQEERPNG